MNHKLDASVMAKSIRKGGKAAKAVKIAPVPARGAGGDGEGVQRALETLAPGVEIVEAEAVAQTPPTFMIAGIGASAGGLEACSQLLEALPAEVGLAIIVVQHLAPQHESMLPELLAAHCKLPVVQVTEG